MLDLVNQLAPLHVARVVRCRGLMPTVAHIAVNVIIWDVTIDLHTVLVTITIG